MLGQGECKNESHAYDTVGMLRATEDSRQPEIPDLDLAEVAVDKDVVALEVPVDHRRIMAVEVGETIEDLPGPTFHGSNVHSRILLPVPVNHPDNSINTWN